MPTAPHATHATHAPRPLPLAGTGPGLGRRGAIPASTSGPRDRHAHGPPLPQRAQGKALARQHDAQRAPGRAPPASGHLPHRVPGGHHCGGGPLRADPALPYPAPVRGQRRRNQVARCDGVEQPAPGRTAPTSTSPHPSTGSPSGSRSPSSGASPWPRPSSSFRSGASSPPACRHGRRNTPSRSWRPRSPSSCSAPPPPI